MCHPLQTEPQMAWAHQRSKHQVIGLPLEKAVALATEDVGPPAHRLWLGRRPGVIN